MRLVNMAAGLAGVALLLAAVPAMAEMPGRLRAMTPESFSTAIVAKHEADATRLVLSTEEAFKPHRHSPIRHLLDDVHLRAVIDARTGRTRYEVHQIIQHWGGQRSFVAAHVPGTAGPRQLRLHTSEPVGNYCPNEDNWGPCAYSRRIAFEIEEADLRAIAARYEPGSAQPWIFGIDDNDGRRWEGAIAPAEAAGLLLAADRHRSGRL